MIERYEVSLAEGLLPLCLSAWARLNQPAEPGQTITFEMVDIDESSSLWQMRREQNNMFDRARGMGTSMCRELDGRWTVAAG